MSETNPVVHYLADYQAPNIEIKSVYLEFHLHPESTRVINRMQIEKISQGPLVLNGEQLMLKALLLDGRDCLSDAEVTDTQLSLSMDGLERFELEIVTQINPQANTALEGLYRSSGNFCTQCEAEGFRKITYYPDRPDVLSVFTTKIIADKAINPVLLSNGNLIEQGDLEDNLHYCVWQDPFKKPCYLFALVAGNLHKISDTFVTADQREIALEIFVEAQNIDKCDHAMASLKRSMKWDEQTFGLIYDLDIYMVVAVDDFNMGAMENKGLNVFNSKFVLAKPETATDVDYEGIEAVIAHEYFHNWTGNRVTCRDWFQLTLKEGLTVFRDQSFTSDMLSPVVKRIDDVKRLRSFQFPEDAGPMSHPIQPQSYIEMNNFYTMTVYEKGSEVVRLYQTLLGKEGFRRGMDLYFARHDGQAVTVQDFRQAMADANDVDLSQMHNWYVQAGTPVVTVLSQYDETSQRLSVSFEQSLPKAEAFEPYLIPMEMGVLDAQGQAMSVQLAAGSEASVVRYTQTGVVLKLSQRSETIVFEQVAQAPVLSLLRQFSAPVILKMTQSDQDLAILAAHDSDEFVRWESMQTLLLKTLQQKVAAIQAQTPMALPHSVNMAFSNALVVNDQTDFAFLAMCLSMPDKTYLVEQYEQVDMDAVLQAWDWLQASLAETFTQQWAQIYQQLNQPVAYAYDKQQIAERKMKSLCLSYLGQVAEHQAKVLAQYQQQANMTDVMAALSVLVKNQIQGYQEALQDFYKRWSNEKLVIDKWFSLQAMMGGDNAVEKVTELMQHADFTLKNPNRARSVLGVFGRMNLEAFHQSDGAGYRLLMNAVIELDQLNPQVAARMVQPLTMWARLDGARQEKMQACLREIIAQTGVSKDVYEIVSKGLQAAKG